MADPEPAVGNKPLNDSLSAISGIMGMVPGLNNVSNLAFGALGLGTAANSVGTGNPMDEGVNAASMVGGGAGILGTVANMFGLSTGVSSALGMTAGAGEIAATTGAGAAIGGAAAAGGVIGAGAAGWGYGNMFNDTVKDMGLAGTGSDGKNRSLSDMAGDHGIGVHDWLHDHLSSTLGEGAADVIGHVGGIGTVLGESVLGTGAAIASAPLVLGRGLWNGIKGLF